MSAVPNGGVQVPFPGATTALQAENERLTVEVTRLQEVLATASCEYVDCVCPGCPRKVPRIWRSGTCEPCAAEDCEHTDGARAVAAERDELQERCRRLEDESNEARRVAIGAEEQRDQARAEVEGLRAERGDACDMCQLAQASAEAERDRLAAVLADVDAAVDDYFRRVLGTPPTDDAEREMARVSTGLWLAALRARAAAAPTGQAGGAQSGSAGPPGGPGVHSHPDSGRWHANCLACLAAPGHVPAVPSAGPHSTAVKAAAAMARAGWWSRYPPISGVVCARCGEWNPVPVTAVHIGVDPAAPGSDRSVDAQDHPQRRRRRGDGPFGEGETGDGP